MIGGDTFEIRPNPNMNVPQPHTTNEAVQLLRQINANLEKLSAQFDAVFDASAHYKQ